ncbi:2Fe-2S iron-sulfur cluster-binding protein [Tardiphaga sp.]|jgi:2Fe-2S ferredoxin|uniref:2Fe-2S iron-sulfur cluster-binding protein n=1 Tax=Tardiphaga sp. TaxID=1926292 RepID=UPI0037DA2E1B
MPQITYIQADGKALAFEIAAGTSVMQGAVTNGVDGIVGECGGCAMCATCHVYVEADPGGLPPLSEEEDALLEGAASERLPNSRLSCQLKVGPEIDGLVVKLPERQV